MLTVPGDSLDAYLHRIHTIPVLNAPEEVVLARGIAGGDAAAAQQLAYHNLRLAASRALRAPRAFTGRLSSRAGSRDDTAPSGLSSRM